MIKHITVDEIPLDLKPHYDNWLEYFKTCVNNAPFESINWTGLDMNMKAHNSKEAYIEWFGIPPPPAQHYRDDGFYTRELTALSSFVQAKKVVEFGTNNGMGTFLLSRVNPSAELITVDIVPTVPHEGDIWYPVGYIAKTNKAQVTYVNEKSWDFVEPNVDFCFIDADHSGEAVYKDSVRAWHNRNKKKWVIAWHDFREYHPDFKGLMESVTRFSEDLGKTVYKLDDSATVFMYGID
jgi:hypothetical protein